MAYRWLEKVQSYFADISDARLAEMYRPLTRGYCAVAAAFFLIVGIGVVPFLEDHRLSLIMLPLRGVLVALALVGFFLTRKTQSMRRLELASLLVSLQISINFVISEHAYFREPALSVYELILVLIGAVSPSLRVFITSATVALICWLWLVVTYVPQNLQLTIIMVMATLVASGVIWGMINLALRSARRALVQSQKRSEELEQFAYICSHDLQEPVRMTHIYSELLVETTGDKLDDEAQNYLGLIQGNAVRMQRMIADILAFSRIGRDGVKTESVDTQAVLADVLCEFEDIIQATGATINHTNLPKLKTSLTVVRAIFHNLISNALKYQDGLRPPQIDITARREKAMWLFSVRDNGIGIDPQYRDKVFMLFQRLNSADDFPGTGIGLSTCRKLLEMYGGEIDFDSTAGKGSRFYFTLPAVGP